MAQATTLPNRRGTCEHSRIAAKTKPTVELLDEHIASRKDWVRYVELKTAMYREHAAKVEAELAPIRDDVLRHEARRDLSPRPSARRDR